MEVSFSHDEISVGIYSIRIAIRIALRIRIAFRIRIAMCMKYPITVLLMHEGSAMTHNITRDKMESLHDNELFRSLVIPLFSVEILCHISR